MFVPRILKPRRLVPFSAAASRKKKQGQPTQIFMAAIAALAFAACVPVFAATTPTAHATTRIPLWKVTSGQRIVYVTGAMNIPLDASPVPERAAEAFAQSGVLVMEGEIGFEAKAERKALLKKYEPIPEGHTLADELTDPQLSRVKMALAAVGLDYNDVQHDQTWAVWMHFVHAAEKKSGRKPHPRYRHFKRLATQRHMPVGHLEHPSRKSRCWPPCRQSCRLPF